MIMNLQRTKAGELLIRPSASESEWYRWLEIIQDWCVSRQLWWGHRVPAYYVKVEGIPEDVRVFCLYACISLRLTFRGHSRRSERSTRIGSSVGQSKKLTSGQRPWRKALRSPSNKTKMSWIHGSRRDYGLSPSMDGPKRLGRFGDVSQSLC